MQTAKMSFRDIFRRVRYWQTLILAVLVPLLACPLPILVDTPEAKCGFILIVVGFYWVTEIIPLAVTSVLPVVLFPVFGIMPAAEVSKAYFKVNTPVHSHHNRSKIWRSKETVMLFWGSLVVAVAVEKWNLHKRLALFILTLVSPQPRWLLLGVILPTWFLSMWISNTATAAMMMPIVSAILLQIKACQESDVVDGTRFFKKNDELVDENGVFMKESESLLEKRESLVKKSESLPEKEKNQMSPSGSPVNRSTPVEKMKKEENEKAVFASILYRPASVNIVASKKPLKMSNTAKRIGFTSIAKSFCLATAYSANIGGVATLTGTPPNYIFKGLADRLYSQANTLNPVNFGNWLILGIPLSFILMVSLWVWLQIFMEGISCFTFWKKEKTSYAKVKAVFSEEYANMGHMSFAEKSVAVCFAFMGFLWITRKPGFISGWGDFFKPKYMGDSIPAVLVSVVLFILPAHNPWKTCQRPRETNLQSDDVNEQKHKTYEKLLDWTTVNNRLAWDVLLLMGGGFALATGCERSGLSAWVSSNLRGLSELPTWAVTLVLSVIIALITEVISNDAITTLFVPIFGQIAIAMGVNPLTFMIVGTLASSLAFMLPVATPPNAIVYSYGYLKISDMVMAGLPMNVICLVVLNIMMNTWAVFIYNLDMVEDAFKLHFITPNPLATTTNP